VTSELFFQEKSWVVVGRRFGVELEEELHTFFSVSVTEIGEVWIRFWGFLFVVAHNPVGVLV